MCRNEEENNNLSIPFTAENPLSVSEAKMYSPLTLAFLGDAVYSILVREMLTLSSNRPTGVLHKESIAFVNAAFQAEMAKRLLPILNETEEAVFKRGRNAHSAHSPKHQSDADYRYATGLEALYGFLYLSGSTDRLTYIFKISTGEAYIEKCKETKE